MKELFCPMEPKGGAQLTRKSLFFKTRRRSLSAIALICLQLPGGITGLARDAGWGEEARRLGLLKPASQLIGRQVRDRHDKTLGKIEDLLLDVTNGKALVTLLSENRGPAWIAVPAESYTFVSNSKLVLGVDKKAFQSAPRASVNQLHGAAAKPLEESFAYFREKMPSENSYTNISSAITLLRAPVLSRAHERLGSVRDLMVDLQRGLVVYVVVEPCDRSGGMDRLYVVPAIAVRLGPGGREVMLDTERDRFLAGPCFSNGFWAEMALSEMATAVCRHYGLEADLVVPSSRSAGQPTDAAITRAVLEEVMQPAHGFVNLDILVTTVHGRVTLAGSVKNEKQRQQLLSTVERVAGIGQVTDELAIGTRKASRL
jgi:sporulation protein YlmC with PRC-barrel domain